MTLGVLSLTYNLGEQTVVASHSFSAPTPTEAASPAVPAVPAVPKPTVPKPTVPKPTVPKPVVTDVVATTNTFDGSVIQSGYGKVQVQVTKSAGAITDVTLLQANATNGRSAAFSYLVQYAIAANGTDFANLSGATYTSDAFKKSLAAALAKF